MKNEIQILHYQSYSTGFMHEWQKYHFVDELRHYGFNITSVSAKFNNGALDEEKTLDSIKNGIKNSKCSNMLFFCTTGDRYITKNILEELKSMGMPLIRLACDDLSVPFMSKKTAKFYDIYWTTVEDNISILESYGANVVCMPFAANPFIFKPTKVQHDNSVGFIGTPYGARMRYLNALDKSGVKVVQYGGNSCEKKSNSIKKNNTKISFSGFLGTLKYTMESVKFSSGRAIIISAILKRMQNTEKNSSISPNIIKKPGPSFREFSNTISSMGLSIGSTELSNTFLLEKPLHNIRLREFEVAMSGGVHIAPRSNLLREYFNEDKEMLMFSSEDELVDKSRYYLDNKHIALRSKLSKSARIRSLKSHTWKNRFDVLFDKLSLSRN